MILLTSVAVLIPQREGKKSSFCYSLCSCRISCVSLPFSEKNLHFPVNFAPHMAWHIQFFLRSSGVLFCGVLLCSLFLVFSFCGLRSVSKCSGGLVKKLHFSWTTLMWGQSLCLDPHSKPTFLHSRYSVQFIRNLRQTTCKDWSWCFVHKDCSVIKANNLEAWR